LSIYLRIGELYTINVVKIYLPLKIIKKENLSALPYPSLQLGLLCIDHRSILRVAITVHYVKIALDLFNGQHIKSLYLRSNSLSSYTKVGMGYKP